MIEPTIASTYFPANLIQSLGPSVPIDVKL